MKKKKARYFYYSWMINVSHSQLNLKTFVQSKLNLTDSNSTYGVFFWHAPNTLWTIQLFMHKLSIFKLSFYCQQSAIFKSELSSYVLCSQLRRWC